MLELYFLIYRIPKMMTRLARERDRSALAWSLIGIGAWIGAELLVGFTFGFVYAIGVEFWRWPERSSGLNLVSYIVALAAALISVNIVASILRNKTREQTFPSPPPPPNFHNPESEDIA